MILTVISSKDFREKKSIIKRQICFQREIEFNFLEFFRYKRPSLLYNSLSYKYDSFTSEPRDTKLY